MSDPTRPHPSLRISIPRANSSRRRAPHPPRPRPLPHPALSYRSPRSPTTRLSLLTLQAHISTALAIATPSTPATTPPPPPSVTVTFTTHATLCHHAVTITCAASAASSTPIPDHCTQCTLHRATRAAKRAWVTAQDLFGALHWRTAAARREYCKARAKEVEEGAVDGDDAVAGRSGAARKTGGKTVAFAEDVVEGSGRPMGAFARGRRTSYVPGRYAGDWVDTSGKSVTFTVFYGGRNEMEEEE